MPQNANIHLFVGEDDYLVEAAARKVIGAAVEPSLRGTAVETVNGDLAVIVSDDTPNYGAPPAFPLSFRFTVSAPGIESLHVTADAPFAVVRREKNRVTLRTETTRDNALFFKFSKAPPRKSGGLKGIDGSRL